jgi:glycosyltransferase involved in cell wall biosynthesis
MQEKGIEDAITAVEKVNTRYNRPIFSLDIYGQIEGTDAEWFKNLQKSFPKYINYCGVIPFDKSTEVLKNYFALLFPTYYEGEGFAGTVIDAEAAGVPIIASDWKYNAEVVVDGKNGRLFPTHDVESLTQHLIEIYENQIEWNAKKVFCLMDARKYEPNKVMKILLSRLA